MSLPDRQTLVALCRRALKARKREYTLELQNLDEAAASETKSSAGDKYETGREMIAQSRTLITHNLLETVAHLETLDRMVAAPLRDRIGFGSLAETSLGCYLVGVSLGELDVGGVIVRTVSLASPLGMALRGKCSGDILPWRGTNLEILRVPLN